MKNSYFIIIFLIQSCCEPQIPVWKKKVDFVLLDSLHSMALRKRVRSHNNGNTVQLSYNYLTEVQPSCQEFDSIVERLEIMSCGVTSDSSTSFWVVHINRNPYAAEGLIICRNCDSTISLEEINRRLKEKDQLLIEPLVNYQPISPRYYWFSTFHTRGDILETLFK